MDNIGTNVQVNLGIKGRSKDIDQLIEKVNQLKKLVDSVKGTYEIGFAVPNIGDVTTKVKALKKELEGVKLNVNTGSSAGSSASSTRTPGPLAGIMGDRNTSKTSLTPAIKDSKVLEDSLFKIENQIKHILSGLDRAQAKTFANTEVISAGSNQPLVPGIPKEGLSSLTESATISPVKKVGGVEFQDTLIKTSSITQQIHGNLLQTEVVNQKIIKRVSEEQEIRKRLSHEIKSTQKDLQKIAEVSVAQGDFKKQITNARVLSELDQNRVTAQQRVNQLAEHGFKVESQKTKYAIAGLEQSSYLVTKMVREREGVRVEREVSGRTGLISKTNVDEKVQAENKFRQNAEFRYQKELDTINRIKAREDELAAHRKRLYKSGFVKLGETDIIRMKLAGQSIDVPIMKMVLHLKDGRDIIHELNPLLEKTKITTVQNAEFERKKKEHLKEQLKIQQELEKKQRISDGLNKFNQEVSSGGFKIGHADQYSNFATEQHGKIIRAHRAIRLGLAKYNVEVLSFNTLTGIMQRNMITGAAASKFLGDSIFRAGEKIAIWTIGTGILFTVMRTVKQLATEIKTLESNTVFMARVSNRLVTSFKDEEDRFRQKLHMAEEITASTIELTRVTGGLADEAQRSAVTFLRSGNDQQEVIYGVAASLMAARIAQLGITESTDLLVSAMRQFRLETKEIIPTLDTLNELSNNYKVTTNDLMQAVSRSGSVFAAHNGTIAELASMTAVIAQRTSRTGAEIGNALKTIESRMDRSDSSRKVFERLAVSTKDFDGEARSLAKTIFELNLRMGDLTTAQERQLAVDIAGIRQVNFLVSALSESEAQIIAMNKALLGSGSAYSEFLESSMTLESALERMKAHITSISQGIRGPLGQLFTGFINTVNIIVSMISYTSALTVAGPALIGMFWLLRQALQRTATFLFVASGGFLNMGIHTKQARWEMGMFNLRAKHTSKEMLTLTGALTTKTGALIAAKSAWIGLKGAILPFLTVGNLVTLVIGGMITAWSLYAAKMKTTMGLLEEERTLADLGTSAGNKKIQAITHTNWAMNLLHGRMLEINRRLKEGKIETDAYNTEMEKLSSTAKNLAKSLSIDTSGLLLDIKIEEDLKKEFTDLLSETFGEQEVWIKLNKSRTQKEVTEAKAEIDKLFKEGNVLKKTGIGDYANPIDVISHADLQRLVLPNILLKQFNQNAKTLTEENIKQFEIFLINKLEKIDPAATLRRKGSWFPGPKETEVLAIEEVLTKVRNLSVEYNKFNTIVEEGTEKITNFNDLLKKSAELDTVEKVDRYKRLHEDIRLLSNETDILFDKSKKFNDIMSAISQKKTYADLIEDYITMNARLDSLNKKTKSFRELHAGISDEEIKEVEDRIVKLEDAVNEARLAIVKTRMEQVKPYIETNMENRFKVIDSIYSNRLKQAQAYRTTLSSIKDIEGKIAQQQISQQRLNRLNIDIQATDDIVHKNALISMSQKELLKLRDLELSKVISISEIETEILETKIQQTKEALRAIGQLDEENKLRLIAQAQYFAANPDAKITTEQMFRMTPESVGIMSQFYGSKQAMIEEQRDNSFMNFLMGTGIGLTQELVQGDRDYQRIRGSLTNYQIAREGVKAANDYDKAERIAAGNDALNFERFNFENAAFDLHVASQIVELTVDKNSFDLSPLIGTFNEFLENTVKSEFTRLFKAATTTEDNYKPRFETPR